MFMGNKYQIQTKCNLHIFYEQNKNTTWLPARFRRYKGKDDGVERYPFTLNL